MSMSPEPKTERQQKSFTRKLEASCLALGLEINDVSPSIQKKLIDYACMLTKIKTKLVFKLVNANQSIDGLDIDDVLVFTQYKGITFKASAANVKIGSSLTASAVLSHGLQNFDNNQDNSNSDNTTKTSPNNSITTYCITLREINQFSQFIEDFQKQLDFTFISEKAQKGYYTMCSMAAKHNGKDFFGKGRTKDNARCDIISEIICHSMFDSDDIKSVEIKRMQLPTNIKTQWSLYVNKNYFTNFLVKNGSQKSNLNYEIKTNQSDEYTISVMINGNTFIGSDCNKTVACVKATLNALKNEFYEFYETNNLNFVKVYDTILLALYELLIKNKSIEKTSRLYKSYVEYDGKIYVGQGNNSKTSDIDAVSTTLLSIITEQTILPSTSNTNNLNREVECPNSHLTQNDDVKLINGTAAAKKDNSLSKSVFLFTFAEPFPSKYAGKPEMIFEKKAPGENSNEYFIFISTMINGVKFLGSGKSKNEACIKAVLSAIKCFQKYHNSNDENLHSAFIFSLREFYQQMRNNILSTTACTNTKGLNCIIVFDGKKYHGKGNTDRMAYSEALANFLVDFLGITETHSVKPESQFNKKHFIHVLSKPPRKKFYMKFEKQGPFGYEMSVKVGEQKFVGIGTTKNNACIRATVSALNYLKQYHNSDDKNLKSAYYSMVYELYQQMSATKMFECTKDADNVEQYKSIIEFNGKTYIGHGIEKCIAYTDAVASVLENLLNNHENNLNNGTTLKPITKETSTASNIDNLTKNPKLNTNIDDNVQIPEQSSSNMIEKFINDQLNINEEPSISNLNSITPDNLSIDTDFYLDILTKSATEIYKINLDKLIDAGDEIHFTMTLTINNINFTGCDNNEKFASIKAAVSAIKYFKNIRNSAKEEFENIIHLLYGQLFEIKEVCVISQSTGGHIFKINIEFDGQSYIGHGPNEEMAIKYAIVKALLAFTASESTNHSNENELKLPTFGKAYFLHVLSKPYTQKLSFTKCNDSNGKVTMFLLINDKKYCGSGNEMMTARIEALTTAFNYFKEQMLKSVTESIRITFECIVQELGLCLLTFNHTRTKRNNYNVFVEFQGKKFTGSGDTEQMAHYDAIATALHDSICLNDKKLLNSDAVPLSSIQSNTNLARFVSHLKKGLNFSEYISTNDLDSLQNVTVCLQIDNEKYHGRGCNVVSACIDTLYMALIENCRPDEKFANSNDSTNTVESSTKKSQIVDCDSEYSKAFIDQVKSGLVFIYSTKNDDQIAASLKINSHRIEATGINADDASFKATIEAVKYCKNSGCKKVLPNPKNETFNADPIELLYKIFPNVKISNVDKVALYDDTSYHTKIVINDQTFTGTGSSKKLSKISAAKMALSTLFNISFNTQPLATDSDVATSSLLLDNKFADEISKLVLNKFNNLTKKSIFNERKVIAGILMTNNDDDIKSAKIIAIATGSKILTGVNLKNNGSVINDSHAEVIVRRCLIYYLYSELELHFNDATSSKSIFSKPLKSGDFYKLKTGIKFHMFVSAIPCGDATFSSLNSNYDIKETNQSNGQLRAKSESSRITTKCVIDKKEQTWADLQSGEHILTMSCSDKIALWNVLGIQGSLLSTIIEPIYISTIILNGLHDKECVSRAFFGRIESLNLPTPYQLNKPKILKCSLSEKQNYDTSPDYSINWIINDDRIEVINARSGTTMDSLNTEVSRLAKKLFFIKYSKLVEQLPGAKSLFHIVGGNYLETKSAARKHKAIKTELIAAFSKNELGFWITKPKEQEQFMVI